MHCHPTDLVGNSNVDVMCENPAPALERRLCVTVECPLADKAVVGYQVIQRPGVVAKWLAECMYTRSL